MSRGRPRPRAFSVMANLSIEDRPLRASPSPSLAGGMFYLARRLAWDVASLETDLVRRPRVRGTAPQAAVGMERRLSLTLSNSRSGGRGLSGSSFLRRAWAMKPKNGWFSSRIPSVYLVDPASSHMLVSKIKPCKCKYSETANGSLNQLWFICLYGFTLITVVILAIIHHA